MLPMVVKRASHKGRWARDLGQKPVSGPVHDAPYKTPAAIDETASSLIVCLSHTYLKMGQCRGRSRLAMKNSPGGGNPGHISPTYHSQGGRNPWGTSREGPIVFNWSRSSWTALCSPGDGFAGTLRTPQTQYGMRVECQTYVECQVTVKEIFEGMVINDLAATQQAYFVSRSSSWTEQKTTLM